MGCLLCVTPKVLIPCNIQTLYNDFSHIEDVHLLFCAHFMNIFSFLRGVEHKTLLSEKCFDGVWFVYYL